MAVLGKSVLKGIKVHLTFDEIQFCQIYGRMRSLVSRGINVVDAKMGDHDGADADVMGFMGELAFAKHFNVYPDIGLTPKSGTPDGVFKGNRYDIKSTERPDGRLLCTLKDNPDVDLYVLCVVKAPIVEIKGWAYKSELVREENLINLGYGNGYGLKQSQLREFQEVKNGR